MTMISTHVNLVHVWTLLFFHPMCTSTIRFCILIQTVVVAGDVTQNTMFVRLVKPIFQNIFSGNAYYPVGRGWM